MPNNITNRIIFKNSADAKQVRDLVTTKESKFDFNAVIPMPKELLDVKVTLPDEPKPAEYYTCKQKYGSGNWYEWGVKHWGTKWNAYQINWEEDSVDFFTAWNEAKPILDLLSKRFAGLEMTYLWADEDFGNNCGVATFDGSKWKRVCAKDGSHEAFQIAAALMEPTQEFFRWDAANGAIVDANEEGFTTLPIETLRLQ